MIPARIRTGLLAIAAAIASIPATAAFAQAKQLDGVVLGYVPTWRDKMSAPKDYNFGAFSHLCRAFLRPQADGTFVTEPNYFDPAFEKAARANGVKLLMSIGGESKSPGRWLAIAHDEKVLARFVDEIGKLYDAHQYDGVDIDWEPPPANAADGRAYLGLLKAIRARFPDKLLTVALSPKNYANQHLPLAEVVDTIDFYNAMAYDFSGPWTGVATFASNLDANKAAGTQVSTRQVMTELVARHKVPPKKIVMGMTFWGNRFRVAKLGDAFPKNTPGAADFLEYGRVVDLLGTGRYTARRDDVSGSMYAVRNGGGTVMTWDDPQSIRAKSQFAKDQGFAGVMMWCTYADATAGTTPLLDAMAGPWGAKAKASPALLEQETALLGNAPVKGKSPDQVRSLNEKLRRDRGIADDDKWMAGTPVVATQPTVK